MGPASLLHTETHLALFTVKGENHCFYLIAYAEDVLSATYVLCPAHFADMDETFDTGYDFYKRTIIRHDYHFALHLVTYL